MAAKSFASGYKEKEVLGHPDLRILHDGNGNRWLYHTEHEAAGSFARVYRAMNLADGSLWVLKKSRLDSPKLYVDEVTDEVRVQYAQAAAQDVARGSTGTGSPAVPAAVTPRAEKARPPVARTRLRSVIKEWEVMHLVGSTLAPRINVITRAAEGKRKAFSLQPAMDGDVFDALLVLHTEGRTEMQPLIASHVLLHAVTRLNVAHTHSPAILHRDIKPENLLHDGKTVFVGDWGLAAMMGTAEAEQQRVGTPMLMAPEMFHMGLKTPAVDMWSLGSSLLMIFTGAEHPWYAASIEAKARGFDVMRDLSVLHDRYAQWYEDGCRLDGHARRHAPFADAFAQVPEPWREVVLRLMAPDPEARLSAQDLLHIFARDQADGARTFANTPAQEAAVRAFWQECGRSGPRRAKDAELHAARSEILARKGAAGAA